MSEQVKNNEQNESKKYVLTITADDVKSTEEIFSKDDLRNGSKYAPVEVHMERYNGEIINRKPEKNEWKISAQTMPRLACQVFEDQILKLSDAEKKQFPVCQYTPDSNLICGIYSSVDEFKRGVNMNTWEYFEYEDNGRHFVIYCWSVFSTIVFVRECLKRFGKAGDKMVLTYREKEKNEKDVHLRDEEETFEIPDEFSGSTLKYRNSYSNALIESKNIIFRGAPGTGKTYLARKIAADIVSGGGTDVYNDLSDEEKKQVEFVQFHPSYDYTDFVEGLWTCVKI